MHRLNTGHLPAWHQRPPSTLVPTSPTASVATPARCCARWCGWTQTSLLNLCLRRQTRRVRAGTSRRQAARQPTLAALAAQGGRAAVEGGRTGPPSLTARQREAVQVRQPVAVVDRRRRRAEGSRKAGEPASQGCLHASGSARPSCLWPTKSRAYGLGVAAVRGCCTVWGPEQWTGRAGQQPAFGWSARKLCRSSLAWICAVGLTLHPLLATLPSRLPARRPRPPS